MRSWARELYENRLPIANVAFDMTRWMNTQTYRNWVDLEFETLAREAGLLDNDPTLPEESP